MAHSVIAEVARSIQITTWRHGPLTYCEVSEDEYREICREHIGGPWLGEMKIYGVPIRVLGRTFT